MGLWGAKGFRCAPAALLVIALTGCAAAAASVPDTTTAATGAPSAAPVAWPSTMAAIGHSGLRGYDTDGSRTDVVADSWATGTNPLVDSVYDRIVAENPAMAGNAVNLAVSGSTVDGLLAQAQALVEVAPAPQLVVVQSIDNDIRCDGTDDEHVLVYRDTLTEVMDTLTAGLPDASIFVVSPWSSVQDWADIVYDVDPVHLTRTGPCSIVDPSIGDEDPARIADVQHIVDQYAGALASVCGEYAQCFTDDGAMRDLDLTAADITVDRQHLTVTGQAKMAAIAFAALREHYSGQPALQASG